MTKTLLSALLALAIAAPCTASATTPEQARAREIYSKLISYNTPKATGRCRRWPGGWRSSSAMPASPTPTSICCRSARPLRWSCAIAGDGSGGKPILLMAHMDVVAADPKDWTARSVHAGRGERLLLRPRHRRRQGRRRHADRDVPAPEEGRLRADARPDHRLHRRRGNRDGDDARSRDDASQADRRRVRAQHRRRRRHARRGRHARGPSACRRRRRPTPTSNSPRTIPAATARAATPTTRSTSWPMRSSRCRRMRFPVMWNDTTVAELRGRRQGGARAGRRGDGAPSPQDPHDAKAVATLAADPGSVGRITHDLRRDDAARRSCGATRCRNRRRRTSTAASSRAWRWTTCARPCRTSSARTSKSRRSARRSPAMPRRCATT